MTYSDLLHMTLFNYKNNGCVVNCNNDYAWRVFYTFHLADFIDELKEDIDNELC